MNQFEAKAAVLDLEPSIFALRRGIGCHMQKTGILQEELETHRQFDTGTLSNAIGVLDTRVRDEGNWRFGKAAGVTPTATWLSKFALASNASPLRASRSSFHLRGFSKPSEAMEKENKC